MGMRSFDSSIFETKLVTYPQVWCLDSESAYFLTAFNKCQSVAWGDLSVYFAWDILAGQSGKEY